LSDCDSELVWVAMLKVEVVEVNEHMAGGAVGA